MENSVVIEKLIKHYRTCSVDRYGQMKTIDLFAITSDPDEQQELGKYVQIGTYGWQYGTYLAFTPWNSFIDDEVKKLCSEAYGKNENRKEALRGW